MKPLLDLNDLVLNYWHILEEGFLSVLEHSTCDDDISNILREIMTGDLLVWVWEKDGIVQGFITTKIQPIGTCPPQKHLIVDHAWITAGTQPLTLTQKTMESMESFAVKCGCNKIKVYSMRDKMGKWFSHLGFNATYSEYVKEVS